MSEVVKYYRHIGDVWMKANINGAGDNAPMKQVDIYMGCLKDNWDLVSDSGSIEHPLIQPGGGMDAIPEKNYSIQIGTKNLPPFLMATTIGMGIAEYLDGKSETFLLEEKATIPLTIDDRAYLDISDIVDTRTNIAKIVSLYRKNDKTWWGFADTASDTDRTFALTTTPGGEIYLDFGVVVESDLTDGEEFVLTIQYNKTMEADDFRFTEDGVTFPNAANFVLSWLVRVESGPRRGKKGCHIVHAEQCKMKCDRLQFGTEEPPKSITFEVKGEISTSFVWLT